MPVCKFYLRGNCRRGDSCHFEHVLPEDDYSSEDGNESRGVSLLKRDNTGYDSSFNDKPYYDASKNSAYKKVNNDRNVQGNYVTVNNNYYGNTPLQRYATDERQQYQSSSERFPNDRYHYNPRQGRQPQPAQHQVQVQPQTQSHQKHPDISIEDLYQLLKADINSIESSQIWPLTSFCLVKLFGSLNDWFDYSPEEMRLAAYLAKASNNFQGYKLTLDNVVSQAQSIRELFKRTSKETSNKLREYMRQQPTAVFPLLYNELDFSQIDYSSFNLAVSGSNGFGYVQESSTVGQQQPAEDTEMMQSTSKPDTLGPRSLMSTVKFGSVPAPNSFSGGFNREQDTKHGLDASGQPQNSQASDNVFGFARKEQSSDTFGFPPSSGQTTNIFGTSVTHRATHGSQPLRDLKKIFPNLSKTDLDLEILSLVWRGDSPFPHVEELTDEEYAQFKASKFTVGKVPLIPPPREFC